MFRLGVQWPVDPLYRVRKEESTYSKSTCWRWYEYNYEHNRAHIVGAFLCPLAITTGTTGTIATTAIATSSQSEGILLDFICLHIRIHRSLCGILHVIWYISYILDDDGENDDGEDDDDSVKGGDKDTSDRIAKGIGIGVGIGAVLIVVTIVAIIVADRRLRKKVGATATDTAAVAQNAMDRRWKNLDDDKAWEKWIIYQRL